MYKKTTTIEEYDDVPHKKSQAGKYYPANTIFLNASLMTGLLEFARDDMNNNVVFQTIVDRLVDMSNMYHEVLTMDDYAAMSTHSGYACFIAAREKFRQRLKEMASLYVRIDFT